MWRILPTTKNPLAEDQNVVKRLGAWLFYLTVIALSFQLIHTWQTRHMLSTTGDVSVPPLTLPALNGGVKTISADINKNTLVYFFAPWCGICRASIGNLDVVDTDKTTVVVIAMDYESIEDVWAFVRDVGVKQDVLLGHNGLKDYFKIQAYPTYYLLDTAFHVIGRDVGYSTAPGIKLKTRDW